MSDLSCPARILLCRATRTHPAEPDQLGVRLGPERVAAVYVSGERAAQEWGAVLALALGLTAQEAGDLVTDAHQALADIADQHRGESVVVVVEDSRLVGLPGPGVPSEGAVTVVEIDADGWRVASL